ncbi:hypothetical protein [Caldisericum exile]|uniref:hypothetical protein n=1 Tax=Caldisericum exile TaxID=693075 RepID=UPI000A05F07F|nr:hypothetical protein [Caldisericum exile]
MKVHNLNNDTEALNYWLKDAEWNFNPQKKYLQISYIVSIQPHLPFSFQFEEIISKPLRGGFSIIAVEPSIPHYEKAGPFREKRIYFNIVVESSKDMNPEVVIRNITLKIRAHRWVKNPEWKEDPERKSSIISRPGWPIVNVEVPKNLNIEIN